MKINSKKLNQKGMTLIELLAAFTITTVIVVSILGSIMSYKNKAQRLSIEKEIINYKNIVTQAIQKDLYRYGLKEATISTSKITGTNTITLNLSDGRSKDLKVVHSIKKSSGQIEKAYISYSDSIKQAGTNKFTEQEVRYYLPFYGNVLDSNNKFKHSYVRFGEAAVTNIPKSNTSTTKAEQAVVKIVIPIYYEEGLNNSIEIIVPANYPIC